MRECSKPRRYHVSAVPTRGLEILIRILLVVHQAQEFEKERLDHVSPTSVVGSLRDTLEQELTEAEMQLALMFGRAQHLREELRIVLQQVCDVVSVDDVVAKSDAHTAVVPTFENGVLAVLDQMRDRILVSAIPKGLPRHVEAVVCELLPGEVFQKSLAAGSQPFAFGAGPSFRWSLAKGPEGIEQLGLARQPTARERGLSRPGKMGGDIEKDGIAQIGPARDIGRSCDAEIVLDIGIADQSENGDIALFNQQMIGGLGPGLGSARDQQLGDAAQALELARSRLDAVRAFQAVRDKAQLVGEPLQPFVGERHGPVAAEPGQSEALAQGGVEVIDLLVRQHQGEERHVLGTPEHGLQGQRDLGRLAHAARTDGDDRPLLRIAGEPTYRPVEMEARALPGEHVAAGGGREPVRQDPVRPFERGSPLLAKDVEEVGANADDDGPTDIVPLTIGELGLQEKARVKDARLVQVTVDVLDDVGPSLGPPLLLQAPGQLDPAPGAEFQYDEMVASGGGGRRQRLPDLLDDDILSAGPRLGRGVRCEHNDARACEGRAGRAAGASTAATPRRTCGYPHRGSSRCRNSPSAFCSMRLQIERLFADSKSRRDWAPDRARVSK